MNHSRPPLARAVRAVLAAVAALAGCPAPSEDPGPDPTPAPPSAADLAPLLQPLRDAGGVPALAAGVVDRDRLLAVGVVGVRVDGRTEPPVVADAFHLGSNTKAMTATLAATFVDEGALAWDAPLPTLFPDLDVDVAWASVTFADLLSHRAGIDDQAVLGPLWATLRGEQDTPRALRGVVAAAVLGEPPTGAPGTFAYSNGGYMLAGAALEELADAAWEDLLRDRVFAPLGMQGCAFGAPGTDVQPPDAPWGHAEGAQGWEPIPPGPDADNPPALGPAGTARCPMPGWAPFARLHLGGEPALVSVGAVERMHADAGDGYGLGWGVVPSSDLGVALQHGGSNTLWNSNLWVFPDAGVAYFAATNAYGTGAIDTFATLDATIVALLEAWPPP